MMISNVIMCMDVCVLLQPLHQAYVRCAGRVGYNTFEELVDRSEIPAYIEVSADSNFKENAQKKVFEKGGASGTITTSMHAPVPHSFDSNTRMTRSKEQIKLEANHTVTYSQRAFSYRGYAYMRLQQNAAAASGSSVSGAWDQSPWMNIKYIWDYNKNQQTATRTADNFVDSNTTIIPSDIVTLPLPPRMPHFRYHASVTSIRLVGLESIIAIDDSFMMQCNSLQHIEFVNLQNLSKIGPKFMMMCKDLKSIDLTGFEALEVLPSEFLFMCPSISTFDYVNNGSMLIIEDTVLMMCQSLRRVSLTGLQNVTTIGNSFMEGCVSLDTFNLLLGTFKNVTSIGDAFLKNCGCLKSINLSEMENIQTIGNFFLSGCWMLTSILLPSSLSTLTRLGSHFMSNCAKLKSVELRGLESLSGIDDHFMRGCTLLQNFVMTGTGSVEVIGESFMEDCTGITSINFDDLANVKLIHSKFMKGCSRLRTLIIPSLTSLSAIHEDFVAGCVSLLTLRIYGSTRRMTLGENFCFGCKSLKSVELPTRGGCLETLVVIPSGFMSGCQSLTTLDISHLMNLARIDNDFCKGCQKLETLQLPPCLHKITTVGCGFLMDCRNLRHNLHLHQMVKVSHIGDHFMVNCPSGDNIVREAEGEVDMGGENASSSHIPVVLEQALTQRGIDSSRKCVIQ